MRIILLAAILLTTTDANAFNFWNDGGFFGARINENSKYSFLLYSINTLQPTKGLVGTYTNPSTSNVPVFGSNGITSDPAGPTTITFPKENSNAGNTTVYCEFVKTAFSAYQTIFSHSGGGATNTRWEIRQDSADSAGIHVYVGNGTGTVGTSMSGTVSNGTVHKVIFRLSGNTISLFVDGAKASDATLTGTQATNTGTVRLGSRQDGLVFNGSFRKAWIIPKAQTDAQCLIDTTL